MARFMLKRSQERPDWWVLTDTENLVVIRFEEGKFNETQKCSALNQEELTADPEVLAKLPRIMREMGDWLRENHYSIVFPTPVYEMYEDEEDGQVCIIRNKFPRFIVQLEDEATAKQLGDALKKAGEFVLKRN